jgi:hypothetical protein
MLNVSYTNLSFSTSTTLEISSGALPDLLSKFLPASLWRASNLILLPILRYTANEQILSGKTKPKNVARKPYS